MPSRLQRALILLAMVLCAVLIADAAYRARGYRAGTSDFDDFHRTVTADLLARRTVTPDHGVHNYLPFFVVFMAPFGLLPMWLGCAVFVALSLALFALAVAIIDRRLVPMPTGPWWLRVAVPAAMVTPFVVSAAVLGQVSLLVTFLIVLSWYLVETRREFWAGWALSLGVLVKVFPVVLVLYFLLKRQWKMLAGVAAGLILLGGLLTTAVFGRSENLRLHREYWRQAVVGHGPLAEMVKIQQVKSTSHNQSLPMVLRRLLTETPAVHHEDGYHSVNLARLPATDISVIGMTLKPIQLVYLGVVMLLMVGPCWTARHAARRTPLDRARLEFAAFTLLCLVLSPLLWVHYVVFGYYALALMTAELMCRIEAGRRAVAGRAVWFAWLFSLPLLGSDYCRAVGVHLWCIVAVMLVLVVWASRVPARDEALLAGVHEASENQKGTAT
ncbi:MAG: DUF2029 domain-containing protein [Phycisphaerales bacterium]|nr:MAG: DUF2029 domain-containing protein [Phycisphaerales bacterium]